MHRSIESILLSICALVVFAACDHASLDSGLSALQKSNGGANGDFNYCDGAVTCDSGEGDCDSDPECTSGLGLVCAKDNGPAFGMPVGWDVCVPAHCIDHVSDGDEGSGNLDCGGSCGSCVCPGANGDADFCSASCPCGAGEGDCDQSADCAPNLICGANNGSGFGFPPSWDVCVAPPPTTFVRHLYWTDTIAGGFSIRHRNLATGVDNQILGAPNVSGPRYLAFSPSANLLFWLDAGSTSIWRVGTDGTGAVVHAPSATCVAVDDVNERVYWCSGNTILSSRFDGSDMQTIISNAGTPSGLGLSISLGKLYWAGTNPRDIRRAGLDGSSIEDVIISYSPTDEAAQIAIDDFAGYIYYTLALSGGGAPTGEIRRATLLGASVTTIASGLRGPASISLDRKSGRIYFTESQEAGPRIAKMKFDGSAVENVVTSGQPWALVLAR